MIQAIRHTGSLPGGAHALLVQTGENLLVVFSKDAADHPDGQWRFDLANTLLCELNTDGDYALDGQLDPGLPKAPAGRFIRGGMRALTAAAVL